MDIFGLNIVFNFVDNASGAMQGTIGMFNQISDAAENMGNSVAQSSQVFSAMSIVGSGIESLGGQFTSLGSKVTSTLKGITTDIIGVGGEMFNARTRLDMLFRDSEGGGEAMLEWIKHYAAVSIFEFQDVMEAALMMKTATIDVRDEIETTSGSAKQTLLDYASDLAAFNPSAHNMYGTGVEAAMGAIKEYIAEGNAKSLQSGFSLKITEILGEAKGDTMEKRTQQIVDLIDKVGMVGMTKSMEGTATNQISNLEDFFFNLKASIADSGIFDFYTEMVSKISEAFTMGDDEAANIAKTFADALLTLKEPINVIVTGVANAIKFLRELCAEHPEIFKLGVRIATVGAIVLTLSGVALTCVGIFMKLSSGLGMLMTSSAPITSVFKLMGASITSFVGALLPIASIIAGVKFAWDNNLFGMRDSLLDAFETIYDTLRITFSFMKNGQISVEDFELAKKLGVMPFITGMLNMQHSFKTFKDGIKSGFDSIMNAIKDFAAKFDPIVIPVKNAFEKVGDFLTKIFGPDKQDNVEGIGNAIGKVIGVISAVTPVATALFKAFQLISSPVGLVIAGVIGAVVLLKKAWDSNLGGIQDKAKTFVDGVKNAFGIFKDMLHFDGDLTDLDTFKEFFEQRFDDAGLSGLFDVISEILPSIKDIKDSIGPIFESFKDIGGSLGESFDSAKPLLGSGVSFIFGIIKSIAGFIFKYIVPAVTRSIAMSTRIISKIMPIVSKVVEWVKDIFVKMSDYVSQAWNGSMGEAIQGAIDFVGNVIDTIGVIVDWLNKYVFEPIIDGVSQAIDFLSPYIEYFINNVCTVFGTVFNVIWDIVNRVIIVFNGIIEFIKNVFLGNWEGAWNAIVDTFTGIWDSVIETIKTVINGVIDLINNAITAINDNIKVPEWVSDLVGHEVSINIPTIPRLNTGGEVTKAGLSVIHPAEVVVNSDTTKKLKEFLNNGQRVSTSNAEGMSINFDKDSINITVQSASDKDIDSLADRLLTIVERKLEKRRMAVRTPIRGN